MPALAHLLNGSSTGLLQKLQVQSDILLEMKDRYGLPPVQVQNIFELASLKLLARGKGINRIVQANGDTRICFDLCSTMMAADLEGLLKGSGYEYEFEQTDFFKIKFPGYMSIKDLGELIGRLRPQDEI